jgi:hypothetical protein
MNPNITNKIIAFLNSTGGATIDTYTRYQLISAEMWLAFAALCLLVVIGCVIACIYCLKRDADRLDNQAFTFLATAFVALIVCGSTVAINLPTVFAPRATAIHQLISDIRGGR